MIGNISFVNIEKSKISSESRLGFMLSNFIGGFLEEDSLLRRVGGPHLRNVSSSLKYFVDGVEIQKGYSNV